MFFSHHFYLSSTSNTSASSSFHPQSQPCWPLPGHTPGPAPLTLMPTNSTLLNSPSSPPSVLPGPGLSGPGDPPAGAIPGWEGLSRERSLGVPHRWQGVSTWQCVCWTPLFPPTGCFFTTVRVQLSESWLPTSSGQEFEGRAPGCWSLSALWEVQPDPLN